MVYLKESSINPGLQEVDPRDLTVASEQVLYSVQQFLSLSALLVLHSRGQYFHAICPRSPAHFYIEPRTALLKWTRLLRHTLLTKAPRYIESIFKMWVLKSGRNLLLKKQDQFKSECLDLKTAKKNPIKEIIMEAQQS